MPKKFWSKQEVKYLRTSKEPLRKQAKHLGRSLSGIWIKRRRLGITKRQFRTVMLRQDEALRLWRSGMSHRAIAKRMEISTGSFAGLFYRIRHNQMAILKEGRNTPSLPTLKFMESENATRA